MRQVLAATELLSSPCPVYHVGRARRLQAHVVGCAAETRVRQLSEMSVKVQVLGVHPVEESDDPCHLIELELSGDGEFDVGTITQPQAGVPEADWQVPYDEHQLVADIGPAIPLDPRQMIQVKGAVRLAFFFHDLAPAAALRTPAGPVALPSVSPRPPRLRFMKYESP
jgi:hypothetical protein